MDRLWKTLEIWPRKALEEGKCSLVIFCGGILEDKNAEKSKDAGGPAPDL